MSLHLRQPVERRRGDGDVKMPALACAGMADVPGTVVTYFQERRLQRRLQCRAQSFHAFAHVGSFSWNPRISQKVVMAVKTKIAGRKNQVLSATHVASGS